MTKKLIEVALPLVAINVASAREKSIRHGHPSTLHLWWARRPLATARAVIFAQMVDDPSSRPELFPTEEAQEAERQRLFRLIEQLVLWENTNNDDLLSQAREEIGKSWRRTCADNRDHVRAAELFNPDKLPAFHDPFAGGGSLPLEAQRLGLEAHASDLNPVAVLINKAMIEIPPRFAGRAPVNPVSQRQQAQMGKIWRGAQGLAEDVRYYGQWMRDEAEKRIGHLYPKVEVTAAMAVERPDLVPYVGKQLTVIAWLWARTVKSPNPAFAHVDVPLVSTFMLSTKAGKEVYVEPVIEHDGYRFAVKVGRPKDEAAAKNGTKLARGANFRCVMSQTPIAGDYIKAEGRAGRIGSRLMAIVAEGNRGRVYLSPLAVHEGVSKEALPNWRPDGEVPARLTGGTCVPYGLTRWGDLFTPRQLVALTTFSDLVTEARERVRHDAESAGLPGTAGVPPAPSLQAAGTAAVPGGWSSRGYLPHFDGGAIPQSITFRLADALPRELLQQWQKELVMLSDTEAAEQQRQRIEAHLDRSEGAAWLKDPRVAELVQNALLHFDGERYHLHAWVVMPTHVHVLMTPMPGFALGEIVGSWKSYTAKQANAILDRAGEFWYPDHFDRYIRDGKHFKSAGDYIENNPVKAGLCARPEQWAFGSAAHKGAGAGSTEAGTAAVSAAGLEGRARGTRAVPEEGLNAGGTGAMAYADAVAVYLSTALSRLTDICNALCRWEVTKTQVRNLFGRQAIPMIWDFAENNVFAAAAGDYLVSLSNMAKALDQMPASGWGISEQVDVRLQRISLNKVVSTDPPYYDNIGYADLSDFFYVWLRRSLKPVYPDLFATVAVPKAEELVATPYRHGSKGKAEAFFLEGMTQAMHRLAEQAHPAFPVTIYYAFKQSENDGADGTSRTGWETFLDAVIRAGFGLCGTWPMRTELSNRMIGSGTNALASSIVLVCRPRDADAPSTTRREFIAALKAELPAALQHMQRSNIAPVDLAQASIGPGMSVYTRFAKVLNADGSLLSVRDALALINQTLDEALAEQEGDFDADSRWALAWFEQSGFAEGEYGVAETLSKAKNTSVSAMVSAGVVAAKAGKVRLLRPSELPGDWDPETDLRLTAWESVHHLVRALEAGGESAAAQLVAKLGGKAEIARELAYRLYTICERTKRSQEALSYNGLVQSWPEIAKLAQGTDQVPAKQGAMFE